MNEFKSWCYFQSVCLHDKSMDKICIWHCVRDGYHSDWNPYLLIGYLFHESSWFSSRHCIPCIRLWNEGENSLPHVVVDFSHNTPRFLSSGIWCSWNIRSQIKHAVKLFPRMRLKCRSIHIISFTNIQNASTRSNASQENVHKRCIVIHPSSHQAHHPNGNMGKWFEIISLQSYFTLGMSFSHPELFKSS